MRAAIQGDATVVCLLRTAIHGVIRRRNTRSGLGHRERNQRAVRTNRCSRNRQRTVDLYCLNLRSACISRIVRCVVADRSDAIRGVRKRSTCTCDGGRRCAYGVPDIAYAAATRLIGSGHRQRNRCIVPAKVSRRDRAGRRRNRRHGLNDRRLKRLECTHGSTCYRAGRQAA